MKRNPPAKIRVNLTLPPGVHATAKAKAALSNKTLQDWLSDVIMAACK